MVELVYKFDEVLLRMFEKVSRLLKYDSKFFGLQTNIYIYQKNHLLVNEKRSVGMAKYFSKKYGNKG